MISRSMVFAILLILMSSAYELKAEVFQYTDDEGGRHFVDDLSLVPEKFRKQLGVNKPLPSINISTPIAPSYKSPNKSTSSSAQVEKRQIKEVEVFTTSWCSNCRKLEAFFDEKGIVYTKYDIEINKDAKRDYTEIGGHGVPLTRVGNRLISGYNPNAIMKIIYE